MGVKKIRLRGSETKGKREDRRKGKVRLDKTEDCHAWEGEEKRTKFTDGTGVGGVGVEAEGLRE